MCTAIVNELIKYHKAEQKALSTSKKAPAELSLNQLRMKTSKAHGLKQTPRLIDILSAVPEEWKSALASKLTIKPVRSASGVSPGPTHEAPPSRIEEPVRAAAAPAHAPLVSRSLS